jgi:hypothetical protein
MNTSYSTLNPLAPPFIPSYSLEETIELEYIDIVNNLLVDLDIMELQQQLHLAREAAKEKERGQGNNNNNNTQHQTSLASIINSPKNHANNLEYIRGKDPSLAKGAFTKRREANRMVRKSGMLQQPVS